MYQKHLYNFIDIDVLVCVLAEEKGGYSNMPAMFSVVFLPVFMQNIGLTVKIFHFVQFEEEIQLLF